MTRPDHPPGHVERHDLAVAKPGVHALAVGCRCRRRQVVLLVKIGERLGRPHLVLPEPLAVRSPERLDDEPDCGSRSEPAGSVAGRRPPIGVSRSASARSSRASWGCPPPVIGVLPICEVTMTRSPQTMGDELPSPASGARQARFSLAPHVVGRPDSCDTPRLDGPRHCGQSPAASSTPDKTRAASQTSAAAERPARHAVARVRGIGRVARRMR